jgi:hypothetical protein
MNAAFALASLAALNSLSVVPNDLLATLQSTSEPTGLIAWGVVLLVVAAGLRKRLSGEKRLPVRQASRIKIPLLPSV